ncbi:hypothetical protein EV284_3534 [Streptomyces sp. BK022]|nr:hypothetical protein EV284_3534 [Streptomyces sp. BK022]
MKRKRRDYGAFLEGLARLGLAVLDALASPFTWM